MKIEDRGLLSADEVIAYIMEAYRAKRGLSIVRLGDGEALTLAQDIVLPSKEVAERGFLAYAGVMVPDLKARDELAAAVKRADVVGVAMNELPDFTPLLNQVFEAHLINPEKMTLTNACINYFLLEKDRLKHFLMTEPRPRVLLIGNVMQFLLPILKRNQIPVAGLIRPVRGVKDWERVADLAVRHRFDVALVSAGIGAVMICERIARETGKIALDFGHAANEVGKRKFL